jgi:hypothetical protein
MVLAVDTLGGGTLEDSKGQCCLRAVFLRGSNSRMVSGMELVEREKAGVIELIMCKWA